MSIRTSANPAPVQVEFGLLAWLEGTRVVLPLKGVEARFEIVGDVAHVELDQIYHQNATKPLDCLYTFPLPAEAAVYRCEFHINGRVISARVEELQEARRLYRKAKAAGQRAALVESERANLFTLNLANVQPDDLVVVRLAYVQTIERVGTECRLRIPFCPGIRYIPGHPVSRDNTGRGAMDDTDQVPDASRISPPRIDKLHPDAAYISVQGLLREEASELAQIESPSHPLKLDPARERTGIELAGGDAVPDQDFVICWELRRATTIRPRLWKAERDGWQYALVELRAPGTEESNLQPLEAHGSHEPSKAPLSPCPLPRCRPRGTGRGEVRG